ncbi:MAG: DUF2934 domain-containing protein [Rhizomicrobium sp.]
MAHSNVPLIEDAIRLRSYQIWQHEGCPYGQAVAHWLQAKAELEAECRADQPPRYPAAFVIPSAPISRPPNKRVSEKIGRPAA